MTNFPDPFDSDMQILQVNVADEITVTLRATSPTASCPDCGTISRTSFQINTVLVTSNNCS
jgi:hypothetical protein